jgi:hypothetical protein
VSRLQSVLEYSSNLCEPHGSTPTGRRLVSRLSLVIGLLFLFLFVFRRDVGASCWASNPTGNRKCQFFERPHGLKLWLCEDHDGDCASLGYKALSTFSPYDQSEDKTKPAQDNEPIRLVKPESPAQPSAKTRNTHASPSSKHSSAILESPVPALTTAASDRREDAIASPQVSSQKAETLSSDMTAIVVALVTGVIGFVLGRYLAAIGF